MYPWITKINPILTKRILSQHEYKEENIYFIYPTRAFLIAIRYSDKTLNTKCILNYILSNEVNENILIHFRVRLA